MILVDYSYDFAKIKANYPEKIGLEQMRVICHISKKTARYLLTSGLVPCMDTGKKTRQYIINTKDVITYLKKRQSQPEKFSAPTGYYSASWNKGGKPKTLTLREWANLDTAKSRKKFQDFLTLKMQPCSDVMSVAEASRFTGYHHNTLTNWCHNGYIRYFEISGGYMIPKSCLLNFLLSPHILDSYRPSKKLVDLAKEFSRQGKSTKKPPHRQMSAIEKSSVPRMSNGGRCFYSSISTTDNLSPVGA